MLDGLGVAFFLIEADKSLRRRSAGDGLRSRTGKRLLLLLLLLRIGSLTVALLLLLLLLSLLLLLLLLLLLVAITQLADVGIVAGN